MSAAALFGPWWRFVGRVGRVVRAGILVVLVTAHTTSVAWAEALVETPMDEASSKASDASSEHGSDDRASPDSPDRAVGDGEADDRDVGVRDAEDRGVADRDVDDRDTDDRDTDDRAASPASWLPPLRPAETSRIQRRLFTKSHRAHVTLGAEYLARGDFHVNPGVTVGAAWFFDELWAVELGASRYFSALDPLASDVRFETGFVPDARTPQWLFRAGARLSAGYGKVLILGRILHFEPQLFVRASVLLADGDASPGGEAGVGLHVHLSREVHLRFDLAAFPHAERRTEWTPVLGVVPSLSIGFGAP